ncbi:MAG: hypothetical protein IJG94_02975 [Clostridia bacterium]|nr:hypothetical protein [Clostridia bacterium]
MRRNNSLIVLSSQLFRCCSDSKAVVEDGRVHMDLGHLGKDKPDYGWTPFVIITEEEYNNLRNGNEL